MILTNLKFSTVFILALFTLSCSIGSYENKYSYFDDYLSSLSEQQQNRITGDPQELEGSGSEPDIRQGINQELPSKFGLKKTKDIVCCSLGYFAGTKDYHCIAKFYAVRILLRNKNRMINGRTGFYSSSIPMRTFEQCVSTRNQPKIFERCCQKAATNRQNKPHFVTVRKKRYEMKMRRIRIPKIMQEDDHLIAV